MRYGNESKRLLQSGREENGMSLREEQCQKVCRILDDVLGNRPTERDSLIVATRSAFRALSEPHWTPVTERLPKEDGSYLVSGKWGSGKESVGDCEFSVEDGYFQTAWNFDVLAWMPLPEPFKGATT